MGSVSEEALWQLAIRACGKYINVGDIHALDEKLLAATFVELYLVGERPPVATLEEFLKTLWPAQWESDRRRIIGIWSKIVRNPQHRFRVLRGGWPWRHPFFQLDQICEAEGLRDVGDRLADQIGLEAVKYRASVKVNPVARDTEAAARVLAMTTRALEVWGATRDAAPDGSWSAGVFWLNKQSDPVRRLAMSTKTGRARHQQWLDKVVAEHERRFPPQQP